MTSDGDEARGDALVHAILISDGDDLEQLVEALMREYSDGYPITSLLELLQHPDARVAEAGAWMASEMPGRLGPVVDALGPLLDHPHPAVRFLLADAVLDNVDDDGRVIAQALLLVLDAERAVRWKALRFALLADRSQLDAAMPFLAPEIVRALEESGLHPPRAGASLHARRQTINRGLAAEDDLTRRWAAAAAARMADRELLMQAGQSTDVDTARFADSELARLIEFGPANVKG